MFSWSTAATSENPEITKRVSRESYTPSSLDESIVPIRATETLVENARLQHRVWGPDLDDMNTTALHLACLMGNSRTLHTILSKGLYCPKEAMHNSPNGANPIMLMSSQLEDKTGNFCLEMFLEALAACENGHIEASGKFKYVACIKCFKHIADKPACKETSASDEEMSVNDETVNTTGNSGKPKPRRQKNRL